MPRAKAKSATGLSIELSENRKFYTPGSKISGKVHLKTTDDFAIGSVNIEFYGRVKVFFVYSHGQGESHHRGRAPLFSFTQVLHEGYHTHKPGAFSWPFVFELPLNPDVIAIRESKHQWQEKEHFLSTDDYIPSHSIPPTFKMRKWGFGYRYHAFIEYVLKVEVKEAQGASMVMPAFSRKAVLPIMVRDIARPESNILPLPLAMNFTIPEQLSGGTAAIKTLDSNPILQSQTLRKTIRTSRLEVWDRKRGSSGSSLSFSSTFRDRTKSIFNSVSLPRYTFDITVSLPGSLRLLEEDSIPFIVDAIPINDNELTTISPEKYPDVRIDNLSLDIGVSTYIRFKSALRSNTKSRYDIKLIDRYPVDYTIDMSKPRNLGQTLEDVDDEKLPIHEGEHNGVNLAKLPGLSVALVSAKLGMQTEKPLAPTFNTYIIAREYTLNWKMELDVAGEKVKVSSDDKIRIKVLPPHIQKLETIMQDADAATAELGDGEGGEGEGESDAESDEIKPGERDIDGAKTILKKKFRKRTTKQEEAAEEAAAAAASSSRTSDDATIPFQGSETLPSYQENPTTTATTPTPADFTYRHEIPDERPPRYEAE